MKLNPDDSLAKLKVLDLSGSKPAQAALAEEKSNKRTKPVKMTTSRRSSHSKGDPAAVVTGYLDPLHVDVLVNLRSRLKLDTLAVPSTNQLLRVALRLVRTLKPSDAQILAAYIEEQNGLG